MKKITNWINNSVEEFSLIVLEQWRIIIFFDLMISGCFIFGGLWTWVLWAHILLLQNWAFTFVSRARNSGSLVRHMKAAFLSNGVWWLSQIIIFTKLFDMITGKGGYLAMIGTGLFYTVFTMSGSIIAHAHALRSEHGKTAVGANKKFKQVSVAEWDLIMAALFPKEIVRPYRKSDKAIGELVYRCEETLPHIAGGVRCILPKGHGGVHLHEEESLRKLGI